MVQEVASTAHYQKLSSAEGAKDLPVFIDFYATWCGQCVRIKPVFEELSNKYAGKALFLKVDVDKCEELSLQFKISAMPTFIAMKNGKQMGIMKGANV
jgi:thioredoxin 1